MAEKPKSSRQFRSPKDYPLKKFGYSGYDSVDRVKYDIDLSPFLEKYKRSGAKIKGGLSIYLTREQGWCYFVKRVSFGVFRDGHYTMVLFRGKRVGNKEAKKKALACIGFNVKDKTVRVVQIQGTRGKRKWLSRIKWERMLVAILIDWAKSNGFEEMKIIQSTESDYYPRFDDKKSEERRERMFLHYDVTAKRMGFKLNKRQKAYILPL